MCTQKQDVPAETEAEIIMRVAIRKIMVSTAKVTPVRLHRHTNQLPFFAAHIIVLVKKI